MGNTDNWISSIFDLVNFWTHNVISVLLLSCLPWSVHRAVNSFKYLRSSVNAWIVSTIKYTDSHRLAYYIEWTRRQCLILNSILLSYFDHFKCIPFPARFQRKFRICHVWSKVINYVNDVSFDEIQGAIKRASSRWSQTRIERKQPSTFSFSRSRALYFTAKSSPVKLLWGQYME